MTDCSPSMNRRTFVAAAGCSVSAVTSGMVSTAHACNADEMQWHHAKDIGVRGCGWPIDELEDPYDRLPKKAMQTVRMQVWGLSKHAAGLYVRFRTDATRIRCRYTLTNENLAMWHMPSTGVSGVDLYAKMDDGVWRWVGVARPVARKTTIDLINGLAPGEKEFISYFPLYNGVQSLEIGVAQDATFQPAAPSQKKPIVFYGTSVLQGGCCSRPGMVFTSILERRLDWPVINLGLSGNGEMETTVGALITEIDAAAYVIDCGPNMLAGQVSQRTGPLVKQLRTAHPNTPILLVEDRINSNATWLPGTMQRQKANHRALREAFDALTKDGVQGLFYLKGDGLIGDDGEATVDGSHPTDIGMMRYADAYEPVLKQMLD